MYSQKNNETDIIMSEKTYCGQTLFSQVVEPVFMKPCSKNIHSKLIQSNFCLIVNKIRFWKYQFKFFNK